MAGLVSYSGSSSEEEPDDALTTANRKRRADDKVLEEPLPLKSSKADDVSDSEGICNKSKPSLPLPGAIRGMFGAAHANSTEDDGEKHRGRVRSFPHLEGNWASYVFVPVSPDERLKAFVDQLLLCLRPLNFEPMEDLHVSLSRTVCIRHHWIQPLTESLKDKFQQLDSCLCDITSIKMYTNDEKTRTFLSLELSADGTNLTDYISTVDACFREFNLPVFYQNPSFHVSLMWCVGDVISQIPEKTKHKLQVLTREFLSTHTDLSVLSVNQVYLKTGNKMFAFHLNNADE